MREATEEMWEVVRRNVETGKETREVEEGERYGAGRVRTDDPRLAKAMLSQLSYSPILNGKYSNQFPAALIILTKFKHKCKQNFNFYQHFYFNHGKTPHTQQNTPPQQGLILD